MKSPPTARWRAAVVLVLLLAAMLIPAPSIAAAPAPSPARVVFTHAFGERPAAGEPDRAPDVEFSLEERRGQVRKGGPSGRELMDSADYTSLAELIVHRDLLLGPGAVPAMLPPGNYECDLLPQVSPEGEATVRLILRGADGQRLSVVLAQLPPESATVSRANAVAFEQPGNAWVVALRLPTAGGAFVLTAASIDGKPRTRTEIIRRELRDRLMHGARPPRRVPR